jgi:RNA polymerase sigma-70 factor (ECF subfamily)
MQTDSVIWLDALRSEEFATRDRATRGLHALLLRTALFELRRRQPTLSHIARGDVEDLAQQAADDALVAVLAKLDGFRGASRFTTWAYKFALLEAGVKARRKAWQGREIALEPDIWPSFQDSGPSAQECAEAVELLTAIQRGVVEALTPHQRVVFCALAVDGVPIDVIAERLNTTRGALYKTLHDARCKLRAELASVGLGPAATAN